MNSTKVRGLWHRLNKPMSDAKFASLEVPSEWQYALRMAKPEGIAILKKRCEEAFASFLNDSSMPKSIEEKQGRYVGRLYRGDVVVFMSRFETEGAANKRISEELCADSGLSHGTVESLGITCTISRAQAGAILYSRPHIQASKSLSFAGSRVWGKANQTRVSFSKG